MRRLRYPALAFGDDDMQCVKTMFCLFLLLAVVACSAGREGEGSATGSCFDQAEAFSSDFLASAEAIREEKLFEASTLIQGSAENQQEVDSLEAMSEIFFVPVNELHSTIERSLAVTVEGYREAGDGASCEGVFDLNDRDKILGMYSELWDQALAALAEMAGG